MKRTLKCGYLAGASAIALGLSLTSLPAMAFEDVTWTWNAEVSETVRKRVNIALDVAPTGMVMLEEFQVSVGDVTAVSRISGVSNNQPTQAGTVDLGEQTYQFKYGISEGTFNDSATPDFNSPEVTDVSVQEACTSGTAGCDGEVVVTIDLGEVDIPASETFDAATDLPSVVSAATSVANNASISSSVSIDLHEKQLVIGNTDGPIAEQDDITSGLQKANISALSNVSEILNASVDSSALAVGNNLTVDLAQSSGTDAVMLADINQWSIADVSATSRVSDISINNYTNLGSIDGALVSSVATALGNNKSITVGNVVVPAAQ